MLLRRLPLARALAMGAAVLWSGTALAEVTRFEVLSREAPALGGRSFGARGQAEKITARATIALDPANPRNAVIADLDRAPRNAEGRVEATTDVVILRPARPNGTLVFDVLNRGRKLLTGRTLDTDTAASSRLDRAEDGGNGFLLDQGFTLVWAAWQADAPGEAGAMRITVPVVPGITGPSREEWSFTDTAGPKRVSLSYPAADRESARLTVRARTDEERATPPGLGLRFIDDSTVEIARPDGMPAGEIYELTYTARDPRVMGMGLAAIRDVTSFLRREGGPANPLAAEERSGLDRAIGFGVSQSGRVLRDVLYFGMNEDEAGRIVFEGMMPIIPGARRSFTNARFAQPGRNPGPQSDRLFPVLQFPFTYEVLDDPVTGRRDGLLLRCRLTNTCPMVMQMDSEFEFWGSQASLLVTDPLGRHIDLPPNVRAYMVAGAPHGNAADAVMRDTPACTLPLNPVYQGPALRALLVAMERWVRDGVEPPSSRYPMLAHGTLVRAELVYPAIPGLSYRGQYVRADAAEQVAPLPVVRGGYPVFLPRAGLDGNAIAGIRLPIIEVPRATYIGWNPQKDGEGPQELCTQVGGVLPFAATRAEREARRDPRPSIEELYPEAGSYEAAVGAATAGMVAERLLLPADAEAAKAAARSGRLSGLSP
ncbi:alpha/beta hydrolase domain-containing protein [Roseomonas populi]|uniref:Alpha/beta hydrolase domain-containing protein n=1 Tax=Roseomonas populi TaxID=3121582 RepID=A0ABT1XBW4_9PROT|nr:alpha/beta hydrolase domain-containing protein [Roseomonas pecuniae]MCR0985618.1 alpha/beta hydrolase domain-containing protein [Roseomonas pecuniae]